jgi:hypothetical protein
MRPLFQRPLQQLGQLGDFDSEALRFVAGELLERRPFAFFGPDQGALRLPRPNTLTTSLRLGTLGLCSLSATGTAKR